VVVAVRAVAVNAAMVSGGPSVVKSATAGPINNRVRARGHRSSANGGPKGSSNSVPSSHRGASHRVRNKHRVNQPQRSCRCQSQGKRRWQHRSRQAMARGRHRDLSGPIGRSASKASGPVGVRDVVVAVVVASRAKHRWVQNHR
jgi:hypothetical protein